jgi:hypothetical protein
MIPNWQIGHLDPQTDEEGSDAYPVPKSGMAERGRKVYASNGCFYCHSEWVRPDYAGSDIDRKWGDRRSAPRDYIFARPVVLGKMRTGPDLSNLGKRAPAEEENPPAGAASPGASPGADGSSVTSPSPPQSPPAKNQPAATSPAPAQNASPAPSPNASPAPTTKPGEAPQYSAAWHHRHLYSPRGVNVDSNMPAYRFLYDKRRISGEPSVDALKLGRADAPPEGWEIVPSYDANCLVAFLMSLDQSHPLKEVKSGAPAAAPAASPAPASQSAGAASPPPKPK